MPLSFLVFCIISLKNLRTSIFKMPFQKFETAQLKNPEKQDRNQYF
ncbi:hypothetical protein D046_2492 [Vibrio parahaemolyticus V-223/04]|nr:hypothetical protein D046_2492 [Vibrio parahaemolyticus V-223/04]